MAIDTDEKALSWLRRFGYLTTDTPTTAQLEAAVVKMQEVYGLTTDGWDGPVTRKAMNMFRCSHKDSNILMVTNPNAVTDVTTRWRKTEITYAVDPAMILADNRVECLSIIRAGFNCFAPLTGLTFHEEDDYEAADIKITAESKAAGMDGVGNILALSGMPNGSSDRPLRTIFDKDEPWQLQPSGPGVIFQAVWMHELGHLLGLSHSSSPNDLMSPYYSPTMLLPQRHDKQRLASLYGIPYVESSDNAQLPVGAYATNGILVIRHDGGIAINLRDVVPTS